MARMSLGGWWRQHDVGGGSRKANLGVREVVGLRAEVFACLKGLAATLAMPGRDAAGVWAACLACVCVDRKKFFLFSQ